MIVKARSLFLRLFRPRIQVETSADFPLIELGSNHGGKVLVDEPELEGALLVSGGAGEDISFDLEFASKYGAQVVLVDPVPRADRHFSAVMERIGGTSEVGYSETGEQSPKSYDLTEITASQFTFISRALAATDDRQVVLFPPTNRAHVSYSAQNLQKTKTLDGVLRARTVSVTAVAGVAARGERTVVKLDIEGSAYEVLSGMFARGFFPRQILVEIDEMLFPSIKNYRRAHMILRTLKRSGYLCVGRKEFDLCFRREEKAPQNKQVPMVPED